MQVGKIIVIGLLVVALLGACVAKPTNNFPTVHTATVVTELAVLTQADGSVYQFGAGTVVTVEACYAESGNAVVRDNDGKHSGYIALADLSADACSWWEGK